MKFICIIIPAFADNIQEEERRKINIERWGIDVFKPKIRKMYGKGNYRIEFLVGYTGSEDKIGELERKYGGMTPKGLLIKEKIIYIINTIKVSDLSSCFVILIDGSGKIVYDSVFNVLKTFENGSEVILGCRQHGRWGIPEDRKRIEVFENFLVSEKYKIQLPDAQCGCWGIRGDILKNISLTAMGYEIELDLITCALESNLDICFAPIKINPSRTKKSSFKIEHHIRKLEFLLHKLSYDDYILKALLKKFENKKGIKLPQWYLEEINEVKFDFLKRNPKCFSGCENHQTLQKIFICN